MSSAPVPVPAPLFRPEALAHAGNRAHGVVLLARPLSYSVVAAMFVVIALSIVAFFAIGTYTRKVQVPGTLMPSRGLIKVMPEQGGLVLESLAKEGQEVHAGDVLFVLSRGRETYGSGNAEQAISALLKARRDNLQQENTQMRLQDSQRLDAARHRAEDMAVEIGRIEDEVALQQSHVAMATTALKRYADLADSNFVSPVQVQDKQAELLDQQQRLAELQRASGAASRAMKTAQAEVRDLLVQAVRDQQSGERNISATEQDLTENEARRQTLVRAPTAGIMSAIAVEQGQTAAAGQALASILPAGSQLEADLYAPSRAVGFLRPGMDVQLRYQAFAYQKFGQARGRVTEIARTASRPEELGVADNAVGNEPVYRVRVKLDRQSVSAYGVEQPLLAGAALDGSIVLEKRRLYEWVLEPLYTISGHLSND